MASGVGTVTFLLGTGTKTINLGASGYTQATIRFRNANILPSRGVFKGGSQFSYASSNEDATAGKMIRVKDNSGTVILEGTTSGISGSNMTFNLTTAPTVAGTMPQALLEFGS